MTPALSCDDSWAAKARIPMGNVHINPRISINNTSCIPKRKLTTDFLWGVSVICDRAMPTAAARSNSESTLPSRNGFTILLGITLSKWSV